jgi:hypothetical protein
VGVHCGHADAFPEALNTKFLCGSMLKLRGLLATLPAFQHRGISSFDMRANPISVEQRTSQSVLFGQPKRLTQKRNQLLADSGASRRSFRAKKTLTCQYVMLTITSVTNDFSIK